MKNINSYFTDDWEEINLPVFHKYFSGADQIIAAMNKPTKRDIFQNRVVSAATYYFVKFCTFYVEKAWCSLTDEQLSIHHCRYDGVNYKIAVIQGAFIRKHKNFKRLDKISFTDVETRYVQV